jgi:SsrA-binding protein
VAKEKPEQKEGTKLVAKNRDAFHNYFVEERFEAGISLTGTEVKSIRDGQISLKEAYAIIDEGQLWILDMNISPYKCGGVYGHTPTRKRKLLMHKAEIKRLADKIKRKGYTLVPISIYFKRGWAKIEIGLCLGKQHHDRRDDIKKRDADREIARYSRRK